MRDVQNEKDHRMVPLKKVGIKDLNWPLKVLLKNNGYQSTVAHINCSVDLHREKRGIHMSRFIEVLNKMEMITPHVFEEILDDLIVTMEAKRAHLEIHFPYFVWKESPVTRKMSPLKVDCFVEAERSKTFSFKIGVKVPVHTLCPCSKEISDHGAHNQRAFVEIQVKTKKFIWFEDLVEIAERNASSPLYTLLKRPDEKFVTERAYENPKFVEDVARDVALELERDNRIAWYRVYVESMESIHNHNAFACVEKGDFILEG
ncbi:GTP cyclohydrolase FolE2 [Thermotoga sp. KOL6]|uniref:GTP cyclohydrolase FolE2 n=1 Tax=Thermotoga sp. KOL6 TaxID=126741 RepID=UPI000C75CD75|nr:GTP cyclohydrolase FolE2 [Thermotoga sp. KOL6]PLV58662.1 GTP cyclohydrolase [Thermotoga sp. KOL6]